MKNLILLISFITLSLFASATVYVVDSLQNSGYGTLRAAVDSASSGDTIRFNPNLIANGSDSIVLTSQIISIKALTFKGLYNSMDTLFISGGGTNRIIRVIGANKMVFDSVTIRNTIRSFNQPINGGALAIFSADTVIIKNSVFYNNKANYGGAICLGNSDNPTLIVSNSKFHNNKALGTYSRGGAIYCDNTGVGFSKILISNSQLYNNSSVYNGGAIFCSGSGSTLGSKVRITDCHIFNNASASGGGVRLTNHIEMDLFITGSTFENNIATSSGHGGAGVYCYSNLGFSKLLIDRSTFSGNISDVGWGGAVFAGSNDTTSITQVINSSFINNEAVFGSAISVSAGGGFNAQLELTSTIVFSDSGYSIENNTVPNITSLGYNIFSDQVLNGSSSTDQLNIDSTSLNLGPLAYNGGSTPTMMPIFPSVAIDMGNPLDSSDAQNAHVSGVRDVGAAEICLPTFSVDSIVACNSYTWLNGITYNANDTSSTYTIANTSGCDSTITLNLTIKPSSYNTDTISTCVSYTWIDGVTYTASNTIAKDTLTNAIGCDSIITLNLTIYPAVTGIDTIVACGSYTWIDGGTYYSNNTTATHTLSNTNGCDSVVTLNLTINQPSASSDVITACDSLVWLDGVTYTSSNSIATFTDTNIFGCDSVITLALTINNSIQTTELVTACNAYTWVNGTTYTVSNSTAIDTLQTVKGCDSIVSLDLTINYSTTAIVTHVVCDSLVWIDGVTYTANNTTATHNMVAGSANGCDSLVTLNLTVNSNSSQYIITACDSLIWIDGITYTSNNFTATHVLTNTLGCDSVVNLELTILSSSQSTHSVSSCGSYTWNGVTYTSNNNTATQTLTNVLGCDSVVTLDLTILQSSTGTAVVSACDSYIWNANTYTANNNTALDTLLNAAGCDSIVTLDLTILSSTSSIETITACDNYTWNGITYTSSNNTAQDTLINAVGCDSIITLNLTILNSSQFTDVISSCNPITWIDGNTYSVNNNTATHVLINSVGCDSVITLDFTILQSTSATDIITSCTPITWIDGTVYNQTTNSPTFTIPNSNGCDSVITLDLTILEVDTTVTRNYLTLTAQASNATYQWIDCANGVMTGETNASFTATINGNYQVAVTQNGCVDTSACFTIANVGVEDIELIGVNLYPNPTSDVLNIDKGSNTSLEITITNSVGAVVYQSNTQNQITTISMAKMAMGMYVVTMKNELGVKVEKVVKR